MRHLWIILLLWASPLFAFAQEGQGTFGFFAAITAAPFVLLAVTCFAKILIVLLLLRAALSAQGVPPGSFLTALALALTAVVMAPVVQAIAATPEASQAASMATSGQLISAISEAQGALAPLLQFMAAHTDPRDSALLGDLAQRLGSSETPILQAIPAFMLSELRDAFRLGVLVLLPFLALDLVLGVILYGLGLQQVDPKTLALPLKLLLLLATNGVSLIIQSLLLTYTRAAP